MKNEVDPLSRFGSQSVSSVSVRARRARLWAALACTTLALVTHTARGAVVEAWIHRYNNVATNSNYEAVKVVRDVYGDFIVIGIIHDGRAAMLTIKYSGVDGSVIWTRRFDGLLYRDRDGDNPYDPDVAVDASGNAVVTVASGSGLGNGGYYTGKYAAENGALLWEKRYKFSANSDDAARAVTVDASGNAVVTGFSYSTNSGPDCYTVKYAAADGAVLWERRHRIPVSSSDEQFVAIDGSGNVVVAFTPDSTNCCGAMGYLTAKYAAADGAVLWENRYSGGGFNDAVFGVTVDGIGNVVVAGALHTVKYAAANGAKVWEKTYTGYAGAVAVDGDNNVVVFRSSSTLKYAGTNGDLLWEWRYSNALFYAKTVAVDVGGNVVVSGASFDSGGRSDYYTAKHAAADGLLLWEKRYNGPAGDYDFARGMDVDTNGNVVVTGYSYPVFDCYTVKYAAADGTLLWEQRYIGPSNLPDVPRAVAVDANGNVVVTGSSSNGKDTDYYTAKYAATNGALLWEQHYTSPGNTNDSPQAITVDSNGDVIVTGTSGTLKYAGADGALHWRTNGGTVVAVDASGNVAVAGYANGISSRDIYTAKYAAADGSLLWDKRYNGPADKTDYATGVAVDASGNVVITGTSHNDYCCQADYYTAKYAATNGALIWEKRHTGTSGDLSGARAVAVDASGNVLVAGDSGTLKYAATDGALLWTQRPTNGSASFVAVDRSGNVVVAGDSPGVPPATGYLDYYTAKYAALDGALLWERRYNGPSDRIDSARAIAVDPAGDAVVTGCSSNGTNNDYHTLKYAAADGALLWEKRYRPDTVSPFELAVSLALGPDGMVAVAASSGGDYATVVYREGISIDLIPGGVRLRFPGVVGQSYQAQRAAAVTGPWTSIATNTALAPGFIEYRDTNAPAGSAFYRTVTLP